MKTFDTDSEDLDLTQKSWTRLPQTRSLSRKTSTLSLRTWTPSYEDLEPVSEALDAEVDAPGSISGSVTPTPKISTLSSSFDEPRRHRPVPLILDPNSGITLSPTAAPDLTPLLRLLLPLLRS